MSLFVIYLCLVLVLPLSFPSSATHPFDRLRSQNHYPVTTYDNSIIYEPPTSIQSKYRGMYSNTVYSNLQPDPQDRRPGQSRVTWGSRSTTITCSQNELPIPDCEAAINIIPTGHLNLDPKAAHSLGTVESQDSVKYNATLPRPLRKFRLPAAFRAGECVVYVRHFRFFEGKMAFLPPVEPPAGFSPAKFMYHTVWPNSRRLAELVIKQCGSRGGFTETTSSPEGNKEAYKTFRYLVTVGIPKQADAKANLRNFNVYE